MKTGGGQDPLPPVTTVGLRDVEFVARYKPFVADFDVPKAIFYQKADLTLNFQSLMRERSFENQA